MIPESLEKRALLLQYVNRAINLLREQETLKEDLNTLKDDVEEELGKDCGRIFKTLYTAKYKTKEYSHDISKKEEALAQVEILEGGDTASPSGDN